MSVVYDKRLVMNFIPQTEIELKTTFVASCIESAANTVGCSASEMYLRMKKVGLVEHYIWKCYDTLHTQSREYVTADILEALDVWERKACEQKGESEVC